MQLVRLGSGFAKSCTTEFVGIEELAAFKVREGEVGEIELVNRPFRRVRFDLIRRNAAAKECELKAEWPAAGRREMPGVIPPFRAKPFVGAVILREAIMITGRGDGERLAAVICGNRLAAEREQHERGDP